MTAATTTKTAAATTKVTTKAPRKATTKAPRKAATTKAPRKAATTKAAKVTTKAPRKATVETLTPLFNTADNQPAPARTREQVLADAKSYAATAVMVDLFGDGDIPGIAEHMVAKFEVTTEEAVAMIKAADEAQAAEDAWRKANATEREMTEDAGFAARQTPPALGNRRSIERGLDALAKLAARVMDELKQGMETRPDAVETWNAAGTAVSHIDLAANELSKVLTATEQPATPRRARKDAKTFTREDLDAEIIDRLTAALSQNGAMTAADLAATTTTGLSATWKQLGRAARLTTPIFTRKVRAGQPPMWDLV